MKIKGYIHGNFDDLIDVDIFLNGDDVETVTLKDSDYNIHLTSANLDLVYSQVDEYYQNAPTRQEELAYAQDRLNDIRRDK